jgi:hypothetical protein
MSAMMFHELASFTSPEDEDQLQWLDAFIQVLDPKCCRPPEITQLLMVFERFPNDDGAGVFWSIVHFLEASNEYELPLIESVQRKACEFNLTMINRLLNVGIESIGGHDLKSLLNDVANNASADQHIRAEARDYIQWQRERCAK